MKKKLALFDLDGTLTRRDTMFAFIAFVRGWPQLLLSMVVLAPTLIGYKLGFVPNERAKQRLLAWHFKGAGEEFLRLRGESFCKQRLPRLFREAALEKLQFHRSKGHEVWVVTASLDLWVAPWLEQQGLNYVSTCAKWEDGRFTGEFASPNCHGPEKLRRLLEHIHRDDYERIYAYGDSKGDKEMLEFAHTAFYRRFV